MTKTNLGLVSYVKSKLTVPTIYMGSGFGRVLTKANVDKRIAKGDTLVIKYESIVRAGIGKYVFDCCGLIKGYMWEVSPGNVPYKVIDGVYVSTSDQNVRGMYNTATEKGTLDTMPDIPGLLVFTADLGHVGVYIGSVDGKRQYVESTPAWKKWGVCQSNDTIRKWTYWGKYHLIEYLKPVPVPTEKTLKKGSVVKFKNPSAKLVYSTRQIIPTWVKNKTHVVASFDSSRARLVGAIDKNGVVTNSGINSWVFIKDIEVI